MLSSFNELNESKLNVLFFKRRGIYLRRGEGTAILFSHVGLEKSSRISLRRVYGSVLGFRCKVQKDFEFLLRSGAQREETTCLNVEEPGFFSPLSNSPSLDEDKVLSSEPSLNGFICFKTIRLSAKQFCLSTGVCL